MEPYGRLLIAVPLPASQVQAHYHGAAGLRQFMAETIRLVLASRAYILLGVKL